MCGRTLEELRSTIAAGDDQLRDYFSYVLLDFATSDADLEEAPFAAALSLARQLGSRTETVTIVGEGIRSSGHLNRFERMPPRS